MFITLYGINNIGKTTQAKRIVERLKMFGKKAMYVKYPVYEIEPSGNFLDRILRSGVPQEMTEEELQMWFTLNRYQNQPILKKLLDEGNYVVAEDYSGTGIAWGVAKGAKLQWLEDLNKYLVKEDLAILMDGERQLGSKETLHIHERDDVLVERCQQVFRDLVVRYGWKVVKVSQVWDETTERLWSEIKKFV